MSLPDETTPQVAAAPATDTDTEVEPGARHLHAVPDETSAEVTGELAPVTDETPAPEAAVPAAAPEPEAPPAPAGASRLPQFTRGALTPRSGLYSTRAASPREVVHRARYGPQLADAGPLRHAAHAYGYWQAAGKIACRTVEWLLFDHPARTLLVTVLVAVVWLLLAQAT